VSLKNQTLESCLERLESVKPNPNLCGSLLLYRGERDSVCPFSHEPDDVPCGDWCPQFDLEHHHFGKESSLTLTLHCTGRRMLLNEKGGVAASRNIKGS